MLNVRWNVRKFHELEIDELFSFLQLRVNVFVVEQKCAYPELDDCDRYVDTRHVSGLDQLGELVAYGRLLPAGSRSAEVSIGRFVVTRELRRKGIGRQLVRKCLAEAEECWPGSAIKIAAQGHLQQFYAQYGFTRVSDVYLEDGVAHVDMIRQPS